MTEVAAGIYCRISKADEADFVKTDDQERICREHAERLGWTVTEVYTDHSKTAWQKNRNRPRWNQMLKDVDAGKINAIVVYHGDRLVRRPEDLTDLLRLAESKGVRLASPSGTKLLDTERLELWIRAAFAEEESQRMSERRKAQYERMRRTGRVNTGAVGGRRYGFETDGLTVRDDEAALLRKAGEMILAGTPTGTVATWLNAQGTTTVTGKPFAHWSVRRLLTRARYAGLMPDGVTQAAWPAIIDRGDWETICGILSARAAQHTTGPARYLLSGIATCGQCGATMQSHRSAPGESVGYACRSCFKVFRSMALLDGYVSRRVVNFLNRPGNLEIGATAPQLPGLAAEFATLTRSHAELRERYVADPSHRHAELMLRRLDRIEERITQLRDHTGDTARLRLIRQHRGITMEQWHGLPLAVRRALVAALFTVVVLPATRRGPGFNPRDVRMTQV